MYSQSPWEHRGERSGAGAVKEVSDPGPGLSPGPSGFILTLGPFGDRRGVKSPGWWWVVSTLVSGPWLVGPISGLDLVGVSSLLPTLALQDDPQCAHRAALWQRWLLRGTGLDFICTHVLYRESGLPPAPSSPGGSWG